MSLQKREDSESEVMAKKNRSTSRFSSVETAEEAASDTMPLVEPVAGDLPDTGAEGPHEPGMPEAAKQLAGQSSAEVAEARATSEEKATETEPEDQAECNPTDKTEAEDEDTNDLLEPSSEEELAENKPLDHDTQELDEEEFSAESAPRVEEIQEQGRKRSGEEVKNDDIIPAKKVMVEVLGENPDKTVKCEE